MGDNEHFADLDDTDQDKDPDEEEEFLPPDFLSSVKNLADSTRNFQALAFEEVAKATLDAILAMGATYMESPHEIFQDPFSKSPRRDLMVNQLKKALGGITEGDKKYGRNALLEAIFDIRPSKDQKQNDTLFAHLYSAIVGEILPQTTKTVDKATISELQTTWAALADSSLWMLLSDYVSLETPNAETIRKQLVLMDLIGALSPSGNWTWDNADEVALCVDNFLAMADHGGAGVGTIDLRGLYRYAASLPMPRGVAAEMIQLALGFLASGAKLAARLEGLPSPTALLHALGPEDSASSNRPADEITDRNALREQATALLNSAMTEFGTQSGKDLTFTTGLSETLFGSQARSMRGRLDLMYNYQIGNLMDGLAASQRRNQIAEGDKRRFFFFLDGCGVGDALKTWSERYIVGDGDNKALEADCLDLRSKMANLISYVVDKELKPALAVAQPCSALALEICLETIELLSGQKGETRNLLQQTLEVLECSGRLGELRTGARLSLKPIRIGLKNRSSLSSFLDSMYGKRNGPWYSDLTQAIDAWANTARGPTLDLDALVSKTQAFVDTVQSAQTPATPFESYCQTEILDAIIPALSEHLQALIGTGNSDAAGRLPALVTGLARLRPLLAQTGDLAAFWKSVTDGFSEDAEFTKDFFARSRHDLLGALAQWDATRSLTAVPPKNLSDLALEISLAVNDYRRLVDESKLPGAKKASFHRAAGILILSIEEVLRTAAKN